MSGLHGCREGKDMTGDNDNDAEFYKREITDIINEIDDKQFLRYLWIEIKGKAEYFNEKYKH